MAHNSEEAGNCTGRIFVGPGHFVGQLRAVILQLWDTPQNQSDLREDDAERCTGEASLAITVIN